MPISKEEGDGKLRGVSVAVQTETDTHSRINQVSTNTQGGNHRRTDEDTEKKEMIPGKAPQRTGSDSKKKKRNQRKRISRKERNQVRAHYGNEGGSSKEMVVKMPIGTNSQILTFLVDTGAQRSFISRKQYEEKLERHTPYEETNVRMYGMGGAEMNIKGQIEVPVHVGGEMLYHKFLIADIEEEAIMGFDFMKKHKVEWTWADQTLQICQS